MRGEGPWRIGESRVERLTDGDTDNLLESWRAWSASSKVAWLERRRAEGFLKGMLNEAGLP